MRAPVSVSVDGGRHWRQLPEPYVYTEPTLDYILPRGGPALGGTRLTIHGKDVYDKAQSLGLQCVAHAGEEGPASYITDALDMLRSVGHAHTLSFPFSHGIPPPLP